MLSRLGTMPERGAPIVSVENLSGIMSIPKDPPYCLVYPTTYVKGAEPDHFNTWNSPTGMRLHHMCMPSHLAVQ